MAKQFLESIPKASVSFDPESGTMTIGGDISSAPPGAMAEMMMAAIITGSPDKAEKLLKAVAEDKGADAAQRVAAMAFGGSDTQSEAHLQKAEKLFAARKLPEAIEEYKLAIAENPEEWLPYMGLGDTYYQMGEFHTAAAYFEESLAIQPYAPTYRYLGDAYLRTEQLDKAIRAYQSSVKTDPNYAPAKRALQYALQRKRGK